MGYWDDEEDEDLNTITPPSAETVEPDVADEISDEATGLEEDQDAETEASLLTASNDDPVPAEVDDPQPQESQALPAAQPPVPSYQSKFEEYKRLQQESGDRYRKLAILDGLSQMGQAFAARHTPDFKPKSNMDLFEKLANRPVEDYNRQQKTDALSVELNDTDKMRDPKSKISEFYRMMAIKRGFEVDESMSAWDISQMSKIMGPNKAPKAPAKASFHDNETGKDIVGVFEDGYYKDQPGGKVFYNTSPVVRPQVSVGPDGRPWVYDPRNPNYARPLQTEVPDLDLPKSPSQPKSPDQPESQQPRIPTGDLYNMIRNKSKTAADQIDAAKKSFEDKAKISLNTIAVVPGLIPRIQEAKTNSRAKEQLQQQLALVFETLPRSDEDMQRQLKENGYADKVANWQENMVDNVLSDEQAAKLLDALQGTLRAAKATAKHKRDMVASQTKPYINGLSDADRSRLIYDIPEEVEVISAKTGKKFLAPADRVDELRKKGLIK